MSTKTLALTGGSGRIGSALIRHLHSLNYNLLNFDLRPSPDLPARFIQADLTQRHQLQPHLENVDALIHLAELPNVNATLPPDELYAHNTRVGVTVLQTAADLKIPRVIYVSSCQVYGCWDQPAVPPKHLPFDETHPTQPQNLYALGKLVNERLAQFLADRHNLSIAIFRFPWVMNLDPTPQFWHNLERATGPLDGLGVYVHLSDAVRAFSLALDHPHPGCETYHFSAAEVMTLHPLATRLQSMPGYPSLPPTWPPAQSPLLTTKAQSHFHWLPTWNLLDLYHQRRHKA